MKAVVVVVLLAGCDLVYGLGGRTDPDATMIDGLAPCGTEERHNPAGCPCETVNAVNMCYLGDPGTPFNPSACNVPGQVTCEANHVWSECIGASLPSQEVCFDTTDNDCNGVEDEGCSCANADTLCFDPSNGQPLERDYLWTTPKPALRNQGFEAYGVSKDPIPFPALDVESGACTGGVIPCTAAGVCAGYVIVAALNLPTNLAWFPTSGEDRVRILRNSGPMPGNPSPCSPTVEAGAIIGSVEIAP